MKKLILLALAAIMVLSMIPAMAFTASAAPKDFEYPEPSDDFWSVWRDPDDYALEEGEPYRPACGYEYTNEGFKVISPVFGEYGTKANVQTSQPVDLKDGFYMEVRIDDFSYKGESGAEDEWISFAISDQRAVGAGASECSNNWLCLIRGAGDGTASNMPFITTRDTEEKPGGFNPVGSFAECKPVMQDGKEVYTFEVLWDGSAYTLKVNGCAVSGDGGKTTEALLAMEQTFVSVVLHSGQKGGKADLTITKTGTSESDADVPSGSDSREPEENLLVYGDPADPATVPENKPAMIFDANKTSIKKDPTGSNMTLTPTGSGAYHIEATGGVPYFMWSPKQELTYMSTDFPVFVMMLKDFVGGDGGVYYCAGNVISATDKYMQGWSQWDDNARFYGADEEYTYIIVDLSTMINNPDDTALQGRIHQVRPHFGVDVNDPDQCEWNIEFCAFFRSVDEALAYGDWYNEEIISTLPVETEDPADTDPAEDTQAPETNEDTNAPETNEDTNAPETNAAETSADTTGETKAETTAETKAEEGGCASVVAFGAVAVLAVAAAAVVLKKKD